MKGLWKVRVPRPPNYPLLYSKHPLLKTIRALFKGPEGGRGGALSSVFHVGEFGLSYSLAIAGAKGYLNRRIMALS